MQMHKKKGHYRMTESIEILVTGGVSEDSVPVVYYAGNSEVQAFRKYKQAKAAYKRMFKARVKKEIFLDTEFIMEWEELESIR